MEEMLPAESNKNVREEVKEQKQSPIAVLSDEVRVPVNNEARFFYNQEVYAHSEKETVSRKKRMKVVEFASITHQGKVQKMLGEVGVVWRPKTRPKNKLRLNMKKLLNPKLTEKKVTVKRRFIISGEFGR